MVKSVTSIIMVLMSNNSQMDLCLFRTFGAFGLCTVLCGQEYPSSPSEDHLSLSHSQPTWFEWADPAHGSLRHVTQTSQ